MQLDDTKPQNWTFTPEELAEVGKALGTPLMHAFLQSLEADALVGKHEVELMQDIGDAPLRILAAGAYAQGQIALAQMLRKFPQGTNENEKTTKKGDS